LLEIKERTKLKEGKHTGIAKNRNLIVLQIEGLQNFVVGLDYNNQEVTPNLNKLIKDDGSLYFNDYHQLLGRGNTSDAEFVTNNSLHPSMEEPTYSQYEKNTFYSLPNLLKDYGYTSWAFHGFEKSFWNREKAYVNQGFERFLSEEEYEFDKEDIIAFGIKDEDFYMQTIDYLKELDKVDDNPFYAFIISLSSHTPFTMPEKYNKLEILKEHDGNMVGDYIQSVHYADYAIGLFLDQLKEEGLYDNSVICIYGDHFGINAAQKEAPLVNSIIGREYDFDTMMNIPLIINIPGEDINETITTTGSQIDFFPTVLNLFGYENKKGLMFGRDLVNYKEDNIVMSQTYMLKGSFITKDLLFEISRDNVFEHSRLINRHTREDLDVEKARDISEYVNREINMSNYILKTDYFKEMKIDEKN
ncbi:MAG TPA: LTA synthase family protein, partial [Tissierellaceae bacterium]